MSIHFPPIAHSLKFPDYHSGFFASTQSLTMVFSFSGATRRGSERYASLCRPDTGWSFCGSGGDSLRKLGREGLGVEAFARVRNLKFLVSRWDSIVFRTVGKTILVRVTLGFHYFYNDFNQKVVIWQRIWQRVSRACFIQIISQQLGIMGDK